MYQSTHGLVGRNNQGTYNNTYTPFTFDRNVRSKTYVKEHIITLYSGDRRSGSSLTNAIFDIDKPIEITGEKAVLIVDKFIVNTNTTNTTETHNIDNFVYDIHLPEISQPNSYSSETKGCSDIVVSNRGHTFQNQNGHCQMPIVDKGLFRAKQLTVSIKFRDIPDLSFWTQNSMLVLVITEELYWGVSAPFAE